MEANLRGYTMICPDCNGKGGWGHGSSERDYQGRLSTRETTSKFYTCDSCNGMGRVDDATGLAIQKRIDDARAKEEADERAWSEEVAMREIAERRESYEKQWTPRR